MLDFVLVDKGLDGQIVDSVASLAVMYQFSWMMFVNDLPMSQMGVTYVVLVGKTNHCE